MTDAPHTEIVDDEDNTLRRAPGWFWPVAIAALLLEALLAWEYLVQVRSVPTTLDQRTLANATPLWITAAWALSVWSGVAGAILLAFRKGLASSLFFVAMVFLVIQYGGLLALPATRGLLVSNELLLPFVILVATYGLWQGAKIGRIKGWLGQR